MASALHRRFESVDTACLSVWLCRHTLAGEHPTGTKLLMDQTDSQGKHAGLDLAGPISASPESDMSRHCDRRVDGLVTIGIRRRALEHFFGNLEIAMEAASGTIADLIKLLHASNAFLQTRRGCIRGRRNMPRQIWRASRKAGGLSRPPFRSGLRRAIRRSA